MTDDTDDCTLCTDIASLADTGLTFPEGERRLRALHADRDHDPTCAFHDADEIQFTLSNAPGSRAWDTALNAGVTGSDIDTRRITIRND